MGYFGEMYGVVAFRCAYPRERGLRATAGIEHKPVETGESSISTHRIFCGTPGPPVDVALRCETFAIHTLRIAPGSLN
jgi:hypothetical protein